jgi:hypothetical protein
MALSQQQIEQIRKKYGYKAANLPSSSAPLQQAAKKSFLKKASDVSGKVLKTGADIFVNPIARALTRPFVETTKGIQSLLPGGKTGKETVKTPFGDITPRDILPSSQGKTALRQSAGETLDIALTGLPVQKVAGKLLSPLAKRAEKIYQAVLKPSDKLLRTSPNLIKTGIEKGITVSRSGLSKTKGMIESIGDDIGRVIETGIADGKTVSKKALAPYLYEMKSYFSNVIGGDKLIKQTNVLSKEYLSKLPDSIPIKKAQEIKQATQNFVKKYYSREAPVGFEVQKQLARGLKEEIAKQVPEISALNKADSELFGLQSALESALKRLGNREIINLSDIASFGAGTMSGGVGTGAAANVVWRILKSPAFSTSRAIFYNRLAKNAQAAIAAGKYPLASAITKVISLFEDDEDQLLK